MTLREAVKFTGIGRDRLYRYVNEGVIPAYRSGNRWLFPRKTTEDWMHRQATKGVTKA